MIKLSEWLIDLAENNYVDVDEFGEIVILPIKEDRDDDSTISVKRE